MKKNQNGPGGAVYWKNNLKNLVRLSLYGKIDHLTLRKKYLREQYNMRVIFKDY